MNLVKSRMTTIGVAAAVLALVAVQALAFSQATQTKDSLQRNSPASTVPVRKAAPPAPAQSVEQSRNSAAPKPAITGVSVDDDSESENDVEDDD